MQIRSSYLGVLAVVLRAIVRSIRSFLTRSVWGLFRDSVRLFVYAAANSVCLYSFVVSDGPFVYVAVKPGLLGTLLLTPIFRSFYLQ